MPSLTAESVEPAVDHTKIDAAMNKLMSDFSGTAVTLAAALGDRLGLFKAMAALGPATSATIARRAEVDERYTREWLSALTAAGYVAYDGATGCFMLPPEYALALAQEGGPMFFGGPLQQLLGLVSVLEPLATAFRTGSGLPYSAYNDDVWAGTERLTAGWFDNLLVQQWLPAVPHVQAQLQRGALVADIGCGHGRALIRLAQAYPSLRGVGYDVQEASIARASDAARAAGVADRVRFEQRDASAGLDEQYDLITTFDVVHDAAHPLELLRAIRRALRPAGSYLCLEVNCRDTLEENTNPIAAAFYAGSLLFCMPLALSGGGEGLGSMGLPESKLRQYCQMAGFSRVQRVPIENPFNVLYEITTEA